MRIPLATKTALIAAILIAFAAITNSQTCTAPGCLDDTFGAGGMTITSPPLNPAGGSTIDSVMQSDGKVVSLLNAASPGTSFRNAIVRFNVEGGVDATFGGGGYTYVGWSAPSGGLASTISVQIVGGEERFVIAGQVPCARTSCLRVERYTNGGVLDNSFGTNGAALVNFIPGLCTSKVQSDQKILLGCQTNLVRLNANGSTDSSFGRSGISQADSGILFHDLLVLSNGRILGGGSVLHGAGPTRDFAVGRFNTDGSLDDGGKKDSTKGDSFGSSGKAVVDFDGNNDLGASLAVDSSGRILLAGEAQYGSNTIPAYDAAIVRFTNAGFLDTSFGTAGKTVLDIGGAQDEFMSIAVQTDGRILATGEGRDGVNPADFLVARYSPDGLPDNGFATGGWLLLDVYGSYNNASNGFIQTDPDCGCAKYVVSGSVGSQFAAVLRFIL